MAKYTFKCKDCGGVKQSYSSSSTKTAICPRCNGDMERALPTLSGKSTVTETINKHLGTVWMEDQKDVLKERKADYYWEVEVPRMVNSGTYSLETMLENKWVYYDEKNQLQTRTKPPEKS